MKESRQNVIKVLFITANNCDDSEVFYPLYRLMEEDVQIDIASFEKTRVRAKYHFEIDANLAVDSVNTDAYDGLLLPGGMAPEKLRQNESVLKIVQAFDKAQKPIAAICHGQQILISSGILKGRKATCYPGIKDDLVNAGANYVNERVVCDRNLVTSRRPEDLLYFMREYVALLKKA